ncbi:cell division cycle-associated protein 3 [Centroberyx affinis]|uniref:cell division cycle-associated protein 3 n=1 Tax=Centroberyx affinis TaxID=166261 RepID=UPI003A5BE254
MGSSESKMTVSSTIKPDSRQTIKHDRVGRLMDPRSPSTDIDRTPIQVGGPVSKTSVEVKTECALPSFDPRSPTIGIARTPARDAMRATVGSFARRLGMLFHGEVEDKAPAPPHGHLNLNVEEEVVVDEELGSGEPLLISQPSQTFGSLAEHANLLSTPLLPRLQSMGDLSPFVHLEEAQVEVETEADLTLEEAEEARESPLHKRLSMSLITCHEGAAPSQIFAEVHHDSTSSPVSSVEVEPLGDGTDHCYALPSINSDPECPMTPVQPSVPTVTDVALVPASSEQPEDAVQMPSSVETQELAVQDSPAPTTLEPATVPSPVLRQERPQPSTGIRCPTFDSKSPSQVVFKPQWLGKGFGATGLRARGVQARGGKGGSSPLAVRVAVKNITNENKGQSAKLKQKGNGLAEGRSPLQILKETNSPRDQNPQMKLKVSTPDRQRLGQVDRRVLTVALDKENR